ncbi:MAG: hypothetical protein J6I64_02805, partial [Lachnospiraceae bacterium]|nr:hypothetical protein [Lachnospiraceae bacterium]
MNSQDLLELVGEIKDEYVQAAGQVSHTSKARKSPRYQKWATVAAACLVCLIGGVWVWNHVGGNAGGGSGSTEGLVYDYYAGPVFPLTMLETAEGLTADREVVFDCSPYTRREDSYENSKGETVTYTRYDSEIIVTDRYLLSNDSAEDMVITALYPFAGSLW